MSITGVNTDLGNLERALQEIEKHTLTQSQMSVLQTMMAGWDDRSEVTDEEEALLYQQFGNNFALGGAIAQVIHIAEKYDKNPTLDAQIKQKITDSMQNWQTQQPSSTFKR